MVMRSPGLTCRPFCGVTLSAVFHHQRGVSGRTLKDLDYSSAIAPECQVLSGFEMAKMLAFVSSPRAQNLKLSQVRNLRFS